MRDLGYVLGQTLLIELRAAEGQPARFPALAAELVDLKVDLIFAPSTPPAQAAKHATTTIPIVFAVAIDPVGDGLIVSLARPGGNITGMTSTALELAAKRRSCSEKRCQASSVSASSRIRASPRRPAPWSRCRRRHGRSGSRSIPWKPEKTNSTLPSPN
jgi:hypothetical protein